ncbi:MAG: ABC transporter ATP-binding protein, partial [Betaproteobacteria bacterium]|nr:ABC transporter ATP-binding protein [Betaproteobacteria bacterium]
MANVELIHVTKKYGETAAVSDLSLSIAQGELVALLGPSGCGKTTTLQMLAGFTELTSGDILVNGKSIKNVPPHKRNIGVVFQSYALFPHLSVFDNVAFGLRMRNMNQVDIGAKVKRALDNVQLSALEDRYPKQMSGGQQQRVALARALVIEPEVLLLDEPLSNLDANLREQMRFEIREIQKRVGITTVFVTHDQSEAMAVADRLVVMSNGGIRQVGTARDIYQSPIDLFVTQFIGHANILNGKVLSSQNNITQVQLSTGDVVQMHNQHGFDANQPVVLALRPELLTITHQPVFGNNQLQGEIDRVN